jgi:ParB family transcriptional regulator, chromosome partitioning protein
MTKEKRLGRGLAALLGEPVESGGEEQHGEHETPRLHQPDGSQPHDHAHQAGSGDLLLIDCHVIEPNPYQPRTVFKPEEIDSLAESLKAHDMLQPLLVRRAGDGYQLISGERRLKAAIQAGWVNVPCRLRQASDREMAELAIVENLQRKDLNAIEKAQSFQRYLTEHDARHDELAERLKIDRSSVSNLLRLLELPTEVQQAVTTGELSASHARALLPLGEEDQQVEFCRLIVKNGLSVRETEMHVNLKIAAEDMEPLAGGGNSSKEKSPRIKRTRSEHITSLEKDLKLAMGTKVEIKANARGRGKLSIHFKSNEEFERVYDLLLGAGGAEISSKAG